MEGGREGSREGGREGERDEWTERGRVGGWKGKGYMEVIVTRNLNA